MEPIPTTNAASSRLALSLALGVAGALAGALAGHLLFGWIWRAGLYAIVLPGALAGLGCGLASGRRILALGFVAAIVALVATVLTEWRFLPFVKDESLAFFLRNLHRLSTVKLLLMTLGVALAFWFGMGRDYAWRRENAGRAS
jgi:hypothetical protein